MTRSPLITLTTDFGDSDGYVGAMKGVIAGLCPAARVWDISHSVPPQDVIAGSYILSQAAPYFPEGAIHVGVIDPGVGSDRRSLIVTSGGRYYVGPDNGLFTFAFGPDATAYRIETPMEASSTFHGRDLYAPTAARLANGETAADLGEAIDDPVMLAIWEKEREGGEIIGRVIHIDRFGNAITNLTPEDFEKPPLGFSIDRHGVPRQIPIKRTYAEVEIGNALWLVGSYGRYELSVREGHAAGRFGVERGDRVHALLDQ